MFKKILIANRGEIALRVIRSCREMGIKTVAVYSDADRTSYHVKNADEAYYIGASPSSESYLRMDKILEVTKKSSAEAIHPGYGFLSENAEFSDKCKDEGIVFIGPSAYAISTMGDKITARKKMLESGVAVVPGTKENLDNDEDLIREANKIGYPIMVKATAGGGGKGMRLVKTEDELLDAVQRAKSEAKSAFGNDDVYMEKYISSPHHIEFQILADNHGNIIHLNERECSIQRRHQKVVEETPSPLMTSKLRERMGEQAIASARAVNYSGAGTIEFLVDDDLNYYFLEMNTRLQVEHPVTEMTTGVDLVKEQIKIAAGYELSITQNEVVQFGHSIECRIYAEDPDNNFMPSPGKITYIREPAGIGVRNDGFIYKNFDVSIYYDPMISKLIVWGRDREEAIERMKRALMEYRISGVKNAITYLYKIMKTPDFVSGKYNTHFIEKNASLLQSKKQLDENIDIALIAVYIDYINKISEQSKCKSITSNKWKENARRKGVK